MVQINENFVLVAIGVLIVGIILLKFKDKF